MGLLRLLSASRTCLHALRHDMTRKGRTFHLHNRSEKSFLEAISNHNGHDPPFDPVQNILESSEQVPLILKSSGYSLQQNGSQEIVSKQLFVFNWI